MAEGWKQIAGVLRVAVITAQRLSLRNVDPLPVRMGHKGVWAFIEALKSWVHRQDMAYSTHITIDRLRRMERHRAANCQTRAQQKPKERLRKQLDDAT